MSCPRPGTVDMRIDIGVFAIGAPMGQPIMNVRVTRSGCAAAVRTPM